MHRKNLCKAVEEGTHNAIELGSAALADAAERLTPLVEQAGDVVGPWAEEARRVSADVANDAYERLKPVLRDAQIRGARLASETLDKAKPVLDDALGAVTPAVDKTVKRVRPVVDDALGMIPPIVDDARSKVQDDLLPRLADVLKEAASQPLAKEAAAQLAVASAIVTKEIAKAQKKAAKRLAKQERTWPATLGKLVLASALLAGVVVAVRKLMTPPTSGWHAHSPSDAYIADPVAHLVDEVAETATEVADDVVAGAKHLAEVADDVASEAGEAVSEVAEGVQEAAAEAADATQDAAIDVAEAVEQQLDEAADRAEGGDANPFVPSPYGEGSFVGPVPPQGYSIKGNARSNKYHVPGSASYERTIAEVWFDSAEHAEAAGFTKPQR